MRASCVAKAALCCRRSSDGLSQSFSGGRKLMKTVMPCQAETRSTTFLAFGGGAWRMKIRATKATRHVGRRFLSSLHAPIRAKNAAIQIETPKTARSLIWHTASANVRRSVPSFIHYPLIRVGRRRYSSFNRMRLPRYYSYSYSPWCRVCVCVCNTSIPERYWRHPICSELEMSHKEDAP